MLARRAVAALVDLALIIAVAGAMFALLADRSGDDWRLEGTGALVANVVAYGYVLAVFGVLQGRTGATPGKALVGVRTVRADATPPGFGRAVARTLLWLVDGAPWVVPGAVAIVTAGTTPGHRRVGDMACETFVVDRRAVRSPDAPPLDLTALVVRADDADGDDAGGPDGVVR